MKATCHSPVLGTPTRQYPRDGLERERALYRSRIIACVVALVAAAAALVWEEADPGLRERAPFLPFFVATVAASWVGGWLPGLFVTAIGVIAASTLFGTAPPGARDWVEAGAFFASCAAVAALGGAWRYTRRRASLAHEDAMQQRERLDIALGVVDEAVIVADSDGCVVHVNSAAQRLTGVPAPLALGRALDVVWRWVDPASGAPLSMAMLGERVTNAGDGPIAIALAAASDGAKDALAARGHVLWVGPSAKPGAQAAGFVVVLRATTGAHAPLNAVDDEHDGAAGHAGGDPRHPDNNEAEARGLDMQGGDMHPLRADRRGYRQSLPGPSAWKNVP